MSHQTAPRPVTPYLCPMCHALWLFWPKEQSGQATDSLNLRSDKSCKHCEQASVEQLERLERVPAVPKHLQSCMPFGLAIEALKMGKRVARDGWNGKGMWLVLVRGYDYDNLKGELVFSTLGCSKLPWIGMKTAANEFVPWLASQTDMLADDWVLVG